MPGAPQWPPNCTPLPLLVHDLGPSQEPEGLESMGHLPPCLGPAQGSPPPPDDWRPQAVSLPPAPPSYSPLPSCSDHPLSPQPGPCPSTLHPRAVYRCPVRLSQVSLPALGSQLRITSHSNSLSPVRGPPACTTFHALLPTVRNEDVTVLSACAVSLHRSATRQGRHRPSCFLKQTQH